MISNTPPSCSPLTEEGRWLSNGPLHSELWPESASAGAGTRREWDLKEERKGAAILPWAPGGGVSAPDQPAGPHFSCICAYG